MAKFPYPPDQDGYEVEWGEESLMVQLAGGAPRIRLDQLGAFALLQVQWTLSRARFNEIQTFYNDTIVHGSLPFTIDLIMKDATVLTEHTAYFVPRTWKTVSMKGDTCVVRAQIFADPDPVPAP